MRRCLMWLLVVPLAVAASQCAHWLAYRLAVPDASLRSEVLAESGHGYLDQAPLVGGIGIGSGLGWLWDSVCSGTFFHKDHYKRSHRHRVS